MVFGHDIAIIDHHWYFLLDENRSQPGGYICTLAIGSGSSARYVSSTLVLLGVCASYRVCDPRHHAEAGGGGDRTRVRLHADTEVKKRAVVAQPDFKGGRCFGTVRHAEICFRIEPRCHI